ncbi:MAG TPA: TIGR03435 family protein [Bryobacteraceae bacterium]
MHRGLVLLALTTIVFPQSAKELEFEVASIRRTPPREKRPAGALEGCRGGPGTNDPELLTCEDMSLFSLALMAYQIERPQYYRLSGPDWMQELPGFDLSARVPAGATKDDLAAMLRNLLADRFKLVVHHESREVQEYDLVVAKGGPKFKESVASAKGAANSDAKGDASDKPKPGADGYPTLPSGHRAAVIDDRAHFHDRQMSITFLAAMLATQLAKPVHDATGLSGYYDIDLHWDTAIHANPPGPGDQTPSALDQGPTLILAVQDQLGLRLESKKGMVDFVVVDHAEKIPAGN